MIKDTAKKLILEIIDTYSSKVYSDNYSKRSLEEARDEKLDLVMKLLEMEYGKRYSYKIYGDFVLANNYRFRNDLKVIIYNNFTGEVVFQFKCFDNELVDEVFLYIIDKYKKLYSDYEKLIAVRKFDKQDLEILKDHFEAIWGIDSKWLKED